MFTFQERKGEAMKPKQLKRIANGEVEKLRQIKACQHEWGGPSQEVHWGDCIKYLHHCKRCSLAKLFDEAKGE